MPVNSFDDYPMAWKPDKARLAAPFYQSIAGALEEGHPVGGTARRHPAAAPAGAGGFSGREPEHHHPGLQGLRAQGAAVRGGGAGHLRRPQRPHQEPALSREGAGGVHRAGNDRAVLSGERHHPGGGADGAGEAGGHPAAGVRAGGGKFPPADGGRGLAAPLPCAGAAGQPADCGGLSERAGRLADFPVQGGGQNRGGSLHLSRISSGWPAFCTSSWWRWRGTRTA